MFGLLHFTTKFLFKIVKIIRTYKNIEKCKKYDKIKNMLKFAGKNYIKKFKF